MALAAKIYMITLNRDLIISLICIYLTVLRAGSQSLILLSYHPLASTWIRTAQMSPDYYFIDVFTKIKLIK